MNHDSGGAVHRSASIVDQPVHDNAHDERPVHETSTMTVIHSVSSLMWVLLWQ
jgi:hypothetical protein